MAKRLTVSFVLATAVVAFVFAGGQQAEEEGTSLAAIGFNATGYPVVNEPYTLTVASRFDNSLYEASFNDLELVKKWTEDTNVQVEWVTFDMASWTEKKNLLLATAEELPDVFLSKLVESDILTYADQGYWVPLEDLIDKYAPNLKETYSNNPGVYKGLFAPDGHLYSLPRFKGDPSMLFPNRMFINKVWLDKLGLEMPGTLDEFEAVLKAFRDGDPNGNRKQDEIALAFRYNEQMSDRTSTGNYRFGLFGFFGTFGRLDTPDHVVVEDDKIVFTADKPEYRDAVKWLRQAYVDGLIDPEAFTLDNTAFRAKNTLDNTLYGVATGWTGPDPIAELNEDHMIQYVYLPPLRNVDGDRIWPRFSYNMAQIGYFQITKDADHPEVAIRWIDYFADPYFSLQNDWGIEGLGTHTNPDGTWEVLDGSIKNRTAEGMAWFGPTTVPPSVYLKRILLPGENKRRVEGALMYDKYGVDVPPNMYFPLDVQDEFVQLRADIQSYVYRTTAKWITEGGIDEGWEEYISTLKRMRLDRWIEIYDSTYQALN
jgi:putative aldouronate transport system substrate-binding protein